MAAMNQPVATVDPTVTNGAELPAYALRLAPGGGTLRRYCLHAFLRLTARRMNGRDVDVARMRARQQYFDSMFGRLDHDVLRTPVDAGGVAAEWVTASGSRPERVVFYLHGGAFVLRFPRTHAGMVGRWCRALGARALMVDYRLAPEHPFPAAPDDCLAAYRWLLAQGIDPANVVFAGDSAGGNLVLVTLQRLKAAGLPLPRCAVLLSPVVDFTLTSRSMIVNEASDPMFTLPGLVVLRRNYAKPQAYTDPGVSPLFGDFTGLPPLLFQAGAIEMLLDESTRAAACAHAAGVAVEFEVWEHMAHVFQALPLPQAAAARERIVAFVRRHTGWAVPAGQVTE
jgi:epsilon-lactone hydrolase